jgi:hypothetical protein
MKIILTLSLFAFSIATSQELTYVEAFGSRIYFELPDTSRWFPDENGMQSSEKYLLMFKRSPILDSLGREVQPVIAAIAEKVNDSLDVITYSLLKRTQIPFSVKKVLTYEDSCFAQRNAVGYEGEYNRQDVIHKVFVVHMRYGSVGLQLVCDSTEGVYTAVEADMRRFIKSVGIDQ